MFRHLYFYLFICFYQRCKPYPKADPTDILSRLIGQNWVIYPPLNKLLKGEFDQINCDSFPAAESTALPTLLPIDEQNWDSVKEEQKQGYG